MTNPPGDKLSRECGLDCAHTWLRMEVAVPESRDVRHARNGMPGKRAINLSLSIDVLEAAKALETNISQVCDNGGVRQPLKIAAAERSRLLSAAT